MVYNFKIQYVVLFILVAIFSTSAVSYAVLSLYLNLVSLLIRPVPRRLL